MPGGVQGKWKLLRFGLLKLLALIVLLSGVVFLSKALGAYQFAFIIGFFAGGFVTQLVIFLKTIGLFINERLNR